AMALICVLPSFFFFFQAEDGIRDKLVTGVQTCALPIYPERPRPCDLRFSLSQGARRSGWAEANRRSDAALDAFRSSRALWTYSRSEERRVGKECRCRGGPYGEKKRKSISLGRGGISAEM